MKKNYRKKSKSRNTSSEKAFNQKRNYKPERNSEQITTGPNLDIKIPKLSKSFEILLKKVDTVMQAVPLIVIEHIEVFFL